VSENRRALCYVTVVNRSRIWIPAIAGLCGALVIAHRRKGKTRAPGRWPANLAHCGASARAPENTLEAFRLAVEEGAGGLELDVHTTQDGEIVVIDDATVDRPTGRLRRRR
jgi:glycerophosphoryl diester phosphodiesterase